MIPDPGLIHPAYDSTEAVGDTPDVGVFFLDDNLSGEEEVLSLIPREHVDGLRIGQPVATLGFPGELKFTERDADNTVNATFKDGTISAPQDPRVRGRRICRRCNTTSIPREALAAARCSTSTDG